MNVSERIVHRGEVDLFVSERGTGHTVVLLHGLAGSSREMRPTADALADAFHVVMVDQRGHGSSTRLPADVSRAAFIDDVVAVVEAVSPTAPVSLAGQSMGAHTAFLTAAHRPDLVERLVMLEGHVDGGSEPGDAADLEAFFASWPTPFAGVAEARDFLGSSVLAGAWIADLARTEDGLVPRFDPATMRCTIEAVHEPRWAEWESLTVPTLAIFAAGGMFTDEQKAELIARRPHTARHDLSGASHDAHLDAFDAWVDALRGFLTRPAGSPRPTRSP